MQVIPVIDLMGGQVVRGLAGRRDEYLPIQSQIAADARPATVARALVEHFGFDTVYVADLDAIMHGNPDVQAWNEISELGLKMWLDAGVGDRQTERRIVKVLQEAGAEFRLIVALESLESLDALMAIAKAWDFPIVSLDLKGGVPQTRIDELRNASPIEIAHQLYDCGVWELIVLDLADVGMNKGTSTIDLCRQIPIRYRGKLIAGGGVRGLEDLQSLSTAGCSHALVASALHDGRLSRADVQRAKQL